jgi:hypothetical protein
VIGDVILERDLEFLALAKVERLQNELLKMPQADIKTIHRFLPGVYERTIVVPPWTVLTGARHKTDYRVRLERGRIAVTMDDGASVLDAVCEFDAKAGVQRAGRVFDEEVVWTDVYANPDDITDISELEAMLYEIPECDLGENRYKNKLDYELFLKQIGMTEEQIQSVVKIDFDLIPMPGGFSVEVKKSALHGMGLFTTKAFRRGDVICPGRLDGKRTPAGRFINHAAIRNAMPVKMDDDIFAVAATDLSAGEEVLINYRDSMRVNFGINVERSG